MNKYLLVALCAALSLCACQQEPSPSGTPEKDYQAKFINTRSQAHSKSFLVKLTEEPSAQWIESLAQKGATSVTKVFTSTKGKEELEHRFGLHLWYEIGVKEAELETLATALAREDIVYTVEYNSIMKKASDCIVYPYKGEPASEQDLATRAETTPTSLFNDPLLGDQWNFKNHGNASIATTAYKGGDINIYEAWTQLTAGDPSIIVAVIDEGVAYSHPDLQSNMWVNAAEYNGKEGVDDDGNGFVDDIYGYNFVANGPITYAKKYDSGHGTHCAGVISAVNNNNIGISSVAGGTGHNDGVRIMTCQIFDNNEGAYPSITSRAIKYAADMGASIISCSFGLAGGTYKSDGEYKRHNGVEADAIAYFEATKNNDIVDGGIAIFASGNDGDPYATYPGAMSEIISVSAYGPDYLPTYYTNYGPGCNIVAPGGEQALPPYTSYKALILSTVPHELYDEHYGYMQGTSMACPHVSGVAALGLSYAKKLGKTFTATKFKELLVTSANDFDKRLNGTKEYVRNIIPPLELYPYVKQMGTGSIDTWLFLTKLEGIPSVTAQYNEKQWIDLSGHFGTASVNLTYLSVDITPQGREALGLAEDPYIEYGRLFIHPTKMGSAKLTIRAVGGGTELGGENNIGGMPIEQEISVIVRSFKSNNGGWL